MVLICHTRPAPKMDNHDSHGADNDRSEDSEHLLTPIVTGIAIVVAAPVVAAGAVIYGAGSILIGVGNALTGGPAFRRRFVE